MLRRQAIGRQSFDKCVGMVLQSFAFIYSSLRIVMDVFPVCLLRLRVEALVTMRCKCCTGVLRKASKARQTNKCPVTFANVQSLRLRAGSVLASAPCEHTCRLRC